MTEHTAHGGAAPQRAWLLPGCGAVLGLLWFLALGGGRALDPTYLDWLGWGDFAQHVLGWLFFREAPWGFPLGKTPDLMRPLTMTVGLSDSNPWVSLALKPFARWLPRDFQFIGPWLALCLALQGVMGVKVMALFTPRAAQQLLGAALFVLAPVLVFRFGHDTLSAHWMLTALLYLSLRPRADARAAWRTLGWVLALNALGAGTHPYLEVMLFALSLALLVSLVWPERLLTWREAGAAFAVGSLVVGGLFVAFGYVGQDVRGGVSGFGVYSADMLALINPMRWSRVLPGLPAREEQYEGFGYLGTGTLALACIALLGHPPMGWRQARAFAKSRLPLLVATALLTLLAFSTTVTLGATTVLTMRKLAEPLMPVLGVFRASGRFIWPLHYLVLTGILALAVWRWRARPALGTAVLLGAVALQVLDTQELWTQNSFRVAPWPRLQAPEWEHLDASFRHVALVPPSIHGSEEPCVQSAFAQEDYVRLGDLAYRKGMTTNSGYAARLNEKHVARVCEALKADVEHGQLAEDTLYVVDPPMLEPFLRQGERVTCGELEGFILCVATREGRFREVLLQHPVRVRRPPTADSPP
ncbi:DUF6311 domain-containing protein [Myxococcus stipitatus]|uniref:DUF6311 domain-containing protein n=1 Tax=Myxococcus stipitatus TaxID=83455 RepID=UPI001F2366FE|nr:DUF6311 domain-containing protein [Myxococcus stipitatus]MCE9667734.1 DUF6311 domain-containing protein [Myxococcus stipitatus]